MIIGLSGYARSGKDTAGDILVANHGFQRASFAAKLKEFALAVDPIVEIQHTSVDNSYAVDGLRLSGLVNQYGWDIAKDRFPEIRQLLQRIGTEAGRNVLGDNVWVEAATKNIHPSFALAFTDCRFPNEAMAIENLGGAVWRIVRPGTEPINAHPSETALDDWHFDAIVHNTGTIDDLAGRVQALMLKGARDEQEVRTS